MTVTATTPLWAACRSLLAEHAEEFFSEWEKAAATLEEEDVHDLRVASRRLREAFALFAPSLPAKKRKKLSKQVRKVTRMLGDLRNTDEAFAFFSQLDADEREESGEEVETLISWLRRQREQAHLRLREELALLDPEPLQREFERVRDGINLFGESGVDPFMGFASFARDAIMERANPASELVAEALQEENGAGQHRLRISLKKLRYRLEIMEPVFSEGYQELRGALKRYQDVLGKLHDIDVFAAMVSDRVRPGPGREALLRVIVARRKALYRDFAALVQEVPVLKIGESARNALDVTLPAPGGGGLRRGTTVTK